MKTLSDMIAIMQAAQDGKQIQAIATEYNDGSIEREWSDCEISPMWDWRHWDYRVKREPRRWKIHIHPRSPSNAEVCHTPEACASEGYEVVDVMELLK